MVPILLAIHEKVKEGKGNGGKVPGILHNLQVVFSSVCPCSSNARFVIYNVPSIGACKAAPGLAILMEQKCRVGLSDILYAGFFKLCRELAAQPVKIHTKIAVE